MTISVSDTLFHDGFQQFCLPPIIPPRVSSSAAGKSQTAFWKAQAAKHDAGGLKRLEQLAKAETADAEGGVEKKDDEEAPVEDEALLDVDEEEDMENDDYYQVGKYKQSFTLLE